MSINNFINIAESKTADLISKSEIKYCHFNGISKDWTLKFKSGAFRVINETQLDTIAKELGFNPEFLITGLGVYSLGVEQMVVTDNDYGIKFHYQNEPAITDPLGNISAEYIKALWSKVYLKLINEKDSKSTNISTKDLNKWLDNNNWTIISMVKAMELLKGSSLELDWNDQANFKGNLKIIENNATAISNAENIKFKF